MVEMEKFVAELRALRKELKDVVRFAGPRPVAMSMEDAAAAVGLGVTKFAQLVKRGEISTFRVDRRRLVGTQELEEWARRQMAPTPLRVPKTRRKTEGDKVRAALRRG